METQTQKPPVDKVDPEKMRTDAKKWLKQDLSAIIALMSFVQNHPLLVDMIVDEIVKTSSGPAINRVIEEQMKKETQNGGN